MGSSGATIVIPPIPSVFQLAVPTLPLVAVGAPWSTTISWGADFPHAGWQFRMDQRQLLGKAVAAITDPTINSFTLTVTASLLLSVGAQVHILGWA